MNLDVGTCTVQQLGELNTLSSRAATGSTAFVAVKIYIAIE